MQACRLAAANLSCVRGERLLFRGLGLDLSSGDALHVTGPNGIGKTSLIRILAGLARPMTGTVARTGSVAMLDERSALDADLPLGRALAFWSAVDRADQTAFAAHVTRLGLDGLADVPVRFLSTGQRKRAAMVRILSQQAPIWLLDEPLNGMDAAGTALIERIVAEHCAGGGLAIVASHQPIALPGQTALPLPDFVPEPEPEPLA